MKRVAVLLLLNFISSFLYRVYANDEIETMMQRTKDVILETPSYFVDSPSDSLLQSLFDLIEIDGSFSDIDYGNNGVADYPSHFHDNRLVVMASAYISISSKYYKSEHLYNCIVNGLWFYYNRHPQSLNWWWNVIDEPQMLGATMILMRFGDKQLPEELEKKLIERMIEDGSHPSLWTVSNRSDVALHFFYRGLLTSDSELIKEATSYIYEPIFYAIGEEGFQIDHSFLFHGMQCYISGYADVLLRGVLRVAVVTHGTQYAISQEKTELMGYYLRETFPNVIRSRFANYNCMGRNVSRKDDLSSLDYWIVNLYNRIKEVDDLHKHDYDTIIKRLKSEIPVEEGIVPTHNFYFCSDYTVHNRDKFNFGLRTQSVRTTRCETMNMENLLGYYISDGSYSITRSGTEYSNIMPLWNWKLLPGVTSPQDVDVPWEDKLNMGCSAWSGGVSDSLYGVTSVKYYDQYMGINTGANKAWFCFDNEIVCLGSNIQSDHHVSTGVNQCWGGSFEITTIGGAYSSINQTNEELIRSDIAYVVHDSIGYYFPEGGNLSISNKKMKGSWTIVNRDYCLDVDSGEVFSLAVDHGKPSGAAYSYIIVPSVSKEGMDNYIERDDIEILENSERMQVVLHKGLGICGMVFYEAGVFDKENLVVKVDKPCILLLNHLNSGSLTCHLQDPTNSRNVISVEVKTPNGITRKGQADFSSVEEPYAGKSLVVDFDLSSGVMDVDTDNDFSVDDQILSGKPFNIYLKNNNAAKVVITSLNGTILRNQNLLDDKGTICINSPGIYVLSVNMEGYKKEKKIVVQ